MRCYVCGALSFLGLFAALAGCCNKPPEPPVLLPATSRGLVDSACRFSVYADDPETDDVSYRVCWSPEDTGDWSGWLPCSEPLWFEHTWNQPGSLDLQAQAQDKHKAQSDWSSPLEYVVGPAAPVPATPLGPDQGIADTLYRFSTWAFEPNGGRLRYRFMWDSEDPTDWTSWLASGDTTAIFHSRPGPGTYQPFPDTCRLRAQSVNEWGIESGWSDPHAFIVFKNWPPDTPDTLWGQLVILPESLGRFWTVTEDPERDDICYRIDWTDGDTTDWSSPLLASGAPVWFEKMFHRPPCQGWWPVFIQAMDEHGARSAWSDTFWVYIWFELPRDTLWEVGGVVRSSPAISPDRTIYVGTVLGELCALRLPDVIRWRADLLAGVYSTPAVGYSGIVYCGSNDGRLYAVDPDGSRRWRFKTSGFVSSSPALTPDGNVVFGSADCNLYCVRQDDGDEVWRFTTRGAVASSPAIGLDRTIYVGSDDSCLYALSASGRRNWTYRTKGAISSSPAIDYHGTVYFGSDDCHLYALNPDGTLKWRYETGDKVSSSPAIGPDSTVFFGSDDYHLYALNPDGTLKWRFRTGNRVVSSPCVCADGSVLFGSDDCDIYQLGPDGEELFHGQGTSPVSSSFTVDAHGIAYYALADRGVYVRYPVPLLADSPWPKFRGNVRNTGVVQP